MIRIALFSFLVCSLIAFPVMADRESPVTGQINGVDYLLLSDDRDSRLRKRSVEIFLHDRVNETDLEAFARSMRQFPNLYDRLSILYYLKGLHRDRGAYATTHFQPELDVVMLGASASERDQLKAMDINAGTGKVLGEWLDDHWAFDLHLLAIVERGDSHFLHRITTSGRTDEEALVASDTRYGTRFDYADPQEISVGDHLVIGAMGVLEIRDSEGELIRSLRPRRPTF